MIPTTNGHTFINNHILQPILLKRQYNNNIIRVNRKNP